MLIACKRAGGKEWAAVQGGRARGVVDPGAGRPRRDQEPRRRARSQGASAACAATACIPWWAVPACSTPDGLAVQPGLRGRPCGSAGLAPSPPVACNSIKCMVAQGEEFRKHMEQQAQLARLASEEGASAAARSGPPAVPARRQPSAAGGSACVLVAAAASAHCSADGRPAAPSGTLLLARGSTELCSDSARPQRQRFALDQPLLGLLHVWVSGASSVLASLTGC